MEEINNLKAGIQLLAELNIYRRRCKRYKILLDRLTEVRDSFDSDSVKVENYNTIINEFYALQGEYD